MFMNLCATGKINVFLYYKPEFLTCKPIRKTLNQPCWWIYNVLIAIRHSTHESTTLSLSLYSALLAMPYLVLCIVEVTITLMSVLFPFYRILSVIWNQGKQTLQFRRERRRPCKLTLANATLSLCTCYVNKLFTREIKKSYHP